MRMWMIDPKFLCRKHLLGEHVELHMFAGTIKKKSSLKGYLEKGLVEPQSIVHRHKALAKEMRNRGYNHRSPLSNFDIPCLGKVDIAKSINDLINRCGECSSRIKNQKK